MARIKKSPKKKVTKKKVLKKKPRKYFIGKTTGRKIYRDEISEGNFTPLEALYVPPFRMSAHFVNTNKQWKLAHASIYKVPKGWKVLHKVEQTPHAWVEHLGMVYDPFFNVYLPQKDYYKLFKIRGVKKYTFKQMRLMLDKKRRYGRWDEILPFEST